MNITCTFGERRHKHESLAELAACVADFRAHAAPAQRRQLVSLGLSSQGAAAVPRGQAENLIASILSERAKAARVEQAKRPNPF